MTGRLRRTLTITILSLLGLSAALVVGDPGLATCFPTCVSDPGSQPELLLLAVLAGLVIAASAFAVAKELLPQMRWTPLSIALLALACVFVFPVDAQRSAPEPPGRTIARLGPTTSPAFQGSILAGTLLLLGGAGLADAAAGRHIPPSRKPRGVRPRAEGVAR